LHFCIQLILFILPTSSKKVVVIPSSTLSPSSPPSSSPSSHHLVAATPSSLHVCAALTGTAITPPIRQHLLPTRFTRGASSRNRILPNPTSPILTKACPIDSFLPFSLIHACFLCLAIAQEQLVNQLHTLVSTQSIHIAIHFPDLRQTSSHIIASTFYQQYAIVISTLS
jgi:hypothetical protein